MLASNATKNVLKVWVPSTAGSCDDTKAIEHNAGSSLQM